MAGTEIALRDDTIVEIGKSISNSARALVPMQGEVMPATGGAAMTMGAGNPALELLTDIRDGIRQMVQVMLDGIQVQKDAIEDANMMADLEQAGSGEDIEPEDTAKPSWLEDLDKGLEKVKPVAEGIGFVAAFLGLAFLLKEYADDLAEITAPFVDGVGAFIGSVKDFTKVLGAEAERFDELSQDGALLGLPLAAFVFRKGFLKLGAAIQGIFAGFNQRFANLFAWFRGVGASFAASTSGGAFIKFLQSGFQAIKGVVGGIGKFFGFFFNNPIVKSVTGVLKFAFNFLRAVPVIGQIIQGIIGIFSFITGAIEGYKTGGFLGAIIGGIKGLFDGLIGSFLNLISGALAWVFDKLGLNFLRDFFKNLDFRADSLIKFFTETLPGYFTTAYEFVKDKFSKIIDFFLQPIIKIVNAAKSFAGALIDKIPSWIMGDERKESIKEAMGLNVEEEMPPAAKTEGVSTTGSLSKDQELAQLMKIEPQDLTQEQTDRIMQLTGGEGYNQTTVVDKISQTPVDKSDKKTGQNISTMSTTKPGTEGNTAVVGSGNSTTVNNVNQTQTFMPIDTRTSDYGIDEMFLSP